MTERTERDRWSAFLFRPLRPLRHQRGTPMLPDSRPMSHSVGTITTFVMPHMQNVRGDLFGGELMALIDQAASVAAIRHAGGPAVTGSIDRVDFRERIPVGALVTVQATVEYVGR